MLLKVLGLVIIMTASTLIGTNLTKNLEGRLKDIRDTQLSLQILEREMVYLSNSLPQALIAASKVRGNVSDIFRECGEILNCKQGYCTDDAWKMAIEKHEQNTFLDAEDKQIILSLSKSLGSYDMQNQTNSIGLVTSQLAIQEKKAEEIITKNSKMYKSLGVLGGAAISIVLL